MLKIDISITNIYFDQFRSRLDLIHYVSCAWTTDDHPFFMRMRPFSLAYQASSFRLSLGIVYMIVSWIIWGGSGSTFFYVGKD